MGSNDSVQIAAARRATARARLHVARRERRGARWWEARRSGRSRADRAEQEIGVAPDKADLLISGLRVEGSDRRNSGSRQLVVEKMGFATVDR